MVAPAGDFTLSTDGIFRDPGLPDPVAPLAGQHQVQDRPSRRSSICWAAGSAIPISCRKRPGACSMGTPPGWARVQAICDFVHEGVSFDYLKASATRTASETLAGRTGVCRDFAHLAIAFCRCMHSGPLLHRIPERHRRAGAASARGFAAWMEVFLEGRWWVFDPRNNTRRTARILIARGRDAADVPLTQTFGPNTLWGSRSGPWKREKMRRTTHRTRGQPPGGASPMPSSPRERRWRVAEPVRYVQFAPETPADPSGRSSP